MKKAAKPKKRVASASAILAREVGKPKNINTVAVDELKCVKAWVAADEATRVRVVGQLATALLNLSHTPNFVEIMFAAWHYHPDFVTMVSLGKAIGRLIRARLPLPEATLRDLTEVSARRSDLSTLRLIAQLEHFAATHAISVELEVAICTLIRQRAGDAIRGGDRLRGLLAPVRDLTEARNDPRERELLAAIQGGDAASRVIYADWLEEHGDLRCAAFLRAEVAGVYSNAISLIVGDAWAKKVRAAR